MPESKLGSWSSGYDAALTCSATQNTSKRAVVLSEADVAGSKSKQSMQVPQVGRSFGNPTTEQISLRQ